MKRIKTSGAEMLENLVRIGEKEVEFENFDATPYVDARLFAKVRRPNQSKESWNYKKRTSTGDKNNIPDISISDESEFEVLGEEDFDEEINILLNKKPTD